MDTKGYKIETLFALSYLLAETAEETRWNHESQDCPFAALLENQLQQLPKVRFLFDQNDDDLPSFKSKFQRRKSFQCFFICDIVFIPTAEIVIT